MSLLGWPGRNLSQTCFYMLARIWQLRIQHGVCLGLWFFVGDQWRLAPACCHWLVHSVHNQEPGCADHHRCTVWQTQGQFATLPVWLLAVLSNTSNSYRSGSAPSESLGMCMLACGCAMIFQECANSAVHVDGVLGDRNVAGSVSQAVCCAPSPCFKVLSCAHGVAFL
jgi:hypothetical protein